MKTETYTLPAHWASALVNEDRTGLSNEESAVLVAWTKENPQLGGCLCCSEDEMFCQPEARAVLPCMCLHFVFAVK